MDVVSFQRKWIGASNLKEKSASQSHFNDLCDLLDVPEPTDIDHTGENYTFERGASITAGGNGWADVWMKGHFAWEYKGQGKNLGDAYVQLLRYKDDLGNPPLMVVSDLNIIRIHTNFTNTVKKVYEYDLNSLSDPGALSTLRKLFTDPLDLRPRQTPDELTAEAAGVFAQVTRGLYDRGQHPESTAHFLVQVVFSLFAEDIGLLPDRIYSEIATADANDPEAFREDTTKLFTAMQGGGRVFLKNIPWVNGGLFNDVNVPLLTTNEIAAIHAATKLDWSQIEPAIFGTLFERSLDPDKRSQLGAHYTSKQDIERVVEPVVMEPLRREWTGIQEAIKSGALKTKKPRNKPMSPAEERVVEYLEQLREVTVLDPACGSGNFLYVALNALLTLEKEVMTWRAINLNQPLGLPEITPKQLKGIEINFHAQQLAQAAIWIGYLQWLNENGFGWQDPILDPLDSIEHRDALLTFHDDGTVTETEWPAARYIIGNPPFLGGKRLRSELSSDYVTHLFRVFNKSVKREADFVVYWFEKARAQIESKLSERAGLLSTNSIRGGASRDVLDRIKSSGDIHMAWSDEPWVLDGAAVRISIIAFDDGSAEPRFLNNQRVDQIHSDLTGAVNITAANRLRENLSLSFMGVTPAGAFDLDAVTGAEMTSMPTNPNGKINIEVIRPYFNGRDVTQTPSGRWIIDFGVDMPESEAAMYEAPFEWVKQHVLPTRQKNARKSYRERWWLHAEPRRAMREAFKGKIRYIATSMVSKHRFFVWLPVEALPANLLIVVAREDDYFFGVLHSRAHEVWSLRMGTSLEDRPRYTPTTTFETYPFPWSPGQEPVDDPRVQAIGDAGKALDDARNAWLNPPDATEAELKKRTLTNLYNGNPTWLRNLHATLERAVWAAYGWPSDEVPAEVEEDVVLSRLLELNLQRASQEW